MKNILFAASLMLTCTLSFADALDLSFNSNAAALKYDTNNEAKSNGNAVFHLGALYNSSSTNSMGDVGLLVRGEENNGVILAIGIKGLSGGIKNYQVGTTLYATALTIGAEVQFIFPAASQFSAGLYYFGSASSVTFGDANRANQWGAHLDYEVAKNTKLYVEFREVDFGIKTTGQTATLDSGAYIGIALGF